MAKRFEHDASRNGFFLQMQNVLKCAGAGLSHFNPLAREEVIGGAGVWEEVAVGACDLLAIVKAK